MILKIFNRFSDAIKRKGLSVVIVRSIQCVFALPVAAIIALISPVLKIRFIMLYTSRIGEYATNNYLIMCALESNKFPEEKICKHFFYAQPNAKICNQFFHQMWARTISIFPYGTFWSFVDRILILLLKEKYHTPFKKQYEKSGGGDDRWEYLLNKRKQFVSFSKKEIEKGVLLTRQLGIPVGKRFVCLLVRDNKYLQVQLSNTEDWKYHEYRNATLENYIPAIEYLISQDYYVIRMGKYVDCPLQIKHPLCIDYASHALRSDFMDIYLSAHCEFFITTNCGIDAIAHLFNKPLLITNSVFFDLDSSLTWICTTFRNVICKKTGLLVPYIEVYRDFEHFFLSGQYPPPQDARRLLLSRWQAKDWAMIENTVDEILAATKETLFFLSHENTKVSKTKEIQQRFWESFPARFILNNLTSESEKMIVSPAFLEKYNHLLITTSEKKDFLHEQESGFLV